MRPIMTRLGLDEVQLAADMERRGGFLTTADFAARIAARVRDLAIHHPRSGGGRSGEAFTLAGERMTIGRSPEAEIFLVDGKFRLKARGLEAVHGVAGANQRGGRKHQRRIDAVALPDALPPSVRQRLERARPIYVAAFIWGGLYLRDARVRNAIGPAR